VLGLLSLVLVLLLGAADPAAARGHHQCGRSRAIASIRVSSDDTGSLISVELRGRRRVRLLRANDQIAALAIADVDNDGDLDILASSAHHGLLIWRHDRRGRFVLATKGVRLPLRPGRGPGVRGTWHAEDALQFGDDRYTVLPRAPGSSAWVFVSQYPLVAAPSIVIPARPRPLGRAPPVHA
jgi:hypothetical protein